MTLGPVSETDLPLLHRWINNRPLVLLSAPYRPVHFSDHDAWWQAVSSDDSVILFAIRSNPEDRLIGTCQLLNINRTHGSAELQIRIGDQNARGRGFGSEAVQLLVTHAFADQRLHRVTLHVLASNTAAIATYEKTGFKREGLLRGAAFIDGRREDVVIMGILSDDVAGSGSERALTTVLGKDMTPSATEDRSERARIAPAELAAALRQLQDQQDEVTRTKWIRSLPLDEELFDRWRRARGLGFGEGASVYHHAFVYGDVRVGENTWIGPMTMLDGSGGLTIGSWCSISAGVQIYSHSTVAWAVTGGVAAHERAPTAIGDRTFVGPLSVVAMGVSVGTRCVIGAHTFVNRDVPDGSVVVGRPGRIIGRTKVTDDGAVRLVYTDGSLHPHGP